MFSGQMRVVSLLGICLVVGSLGLLGCDLLEPESPGDPPVEIPEDPTKDPVEDPTEETASYRYNLADINGKRVPQWDESSWRSSERWDSLRQVWDGMNFRVRTIGGELQVDDVRKHYVLSVRLEYARYTSHIWGASPYTYWKDTLSVSGTYEAQGPLLYFQYANGPGPQFFGRVEGTTVNLRYFNREILAALDIRVYRQEPIFSLEESHGRAFSSSVTRESTSMYFDLAEYRSGQLPYELNLSTSGTYAEWADVMSGFLSIDNGRFERGDSMFFYSASFRGGRSGPEKEQWYITGWIKQYGHLFYLEPENARIPPRIRYGDNKEPQFGIFQGDSLFIYEGGSVYPHVYVPSAKE